MSLDDEYKFLEFLRLHIFVDTSKENRDLITHDILKHIVNLNPIEYST